MRKARALSYPGDVHAVGLERGGELRVVDGRGDLAGVVVAPLERSRDGPARIDRRRLHLARVDLGEELRVAEALGRRGRGVGEGEQQQRDDQAEREEPHPPPRRRRRRRCWGPVPRLTRLRCSGHVADPVRTMGTPFAGNLEAGLDWIAACRLGSVWDIRATRVVRDESSAPSYLWPRADEGRSSRVSRGDVGISYQGPDID